MNEGFGVGVPARVGRYDVSGVIGRGAMGVILRAHDPDLDRDVAIKLVATELLAGADAAEYLDRFRREARAAGRCAHANIVGVHDYGLQDGKPFLAMEFVDGTSLQAVLASGRRLAVVEAARIVSQVLDALACAHAAGIVHRDIKPANILLLPDLRVKVTDFGIAKFGDSDLTRAGDMIGTPSYMSPEQCLGAPVDARSDLFSTGTILHELLTGGRAFAGGSALEVARRVVDGEPPPLPSAVTEAHPALSDVLDRALAKRPEDRFPDARAMAAALRSAVRGEPDDATVITTPPRLGLDVSEMAALERGLASQLGPVAGALVRSAARQATTRDALLDVLAEHIPDEAGRRRFRDSAGATGRYGTGGHVAAERPAPGGAAATAEELARARGALLPHVGPIAAMLVKREAAGGASVEEVWRRLSLHVEDAAERARFLKKREG